MAQDGIEILLYITKIMRETDKIKKQMKDRYGNMLSDEEENKYIGKILMKKFSPFQLPAVECKPTLPDISDLVDSDYRAFIDSIGIF